MTTLQTRPHRSSRKAFTRPRLLVELCLLVLGYLAYSGTRVAVRGDHALAMHNGRLVYHVERRWAPEVWLNQVVNAHVTLAKISGYYYTTLHFIVTLVVICWLYWRHPEHYRPLRTTLIAGTLIALVGFWLFPVAPPRDVVPNLTDTVAHWDIMELAAPRSGNSVANLYAAMPSLHVGWAVWCAFVIWWVYRQRHPVLATLGFIYPILTTLVVLATANHYLLDCIGGVAAIGTGMLVARAFGEWPGHRRKKEAEAAAREVEAAANEAEASESYGGVRVADGVQPEDDLRDADVAVGRNASVLHRFGRRDVHFLLGRRATRPADTNSDGDRR